jgi:hypothetical protein
VIYLQIRKPDVTPVELANADEVHHPHMHHPHMPHPHLPHLPHAEGGKLEASES